LALGELVRCVEDCDELLAALDVEAMGVDANPNDVSKGAMRLKALVRRSHPFQHLMLTLDFRREFELFESCSCFPHPFYYLFFFFFRS